MTFPCRISINERKKNSHHDNESENNEPLCKKGNKKKRRKIRNDSAHIPFAWREKRWKLNKFERICVFFSEVGPGRREKLLLPKTTVAARKDTRINHYGGGLRKLSDGFLIRLIFILLLRPSFWENSPPLPEWRQSVARSRNSGRCVCVWLCCGIEPQNCCLFLNDRFEILWECGICGRNLRKWGTFCWSQTREVMLRRRDFARNLMIFFLRRYHKLKKIFQIVWIAIENYSPFARIKS